jgi:hypothetical protein
MKTGADIEKVKRYLVVILACIALVVAYVRFFKKDSVAVATDTAGKAAAAGLDSTALMNKLSGTKPIRFSVEKTAHEFQEDIRDIFEPARSLIRNSGPAPEEIVTAPEIDLELKGIISGGDHPVAIINQEFLRTGDTIGGYRLEQITPRNVILVSGKKTKVLELMAAKRGPSKP